MDFEINIIFLIMSNNNSRIDCALKRMKHFSKAHEPIKYLRWSCIL